MTSGDAGNDFLSGDIGNDFLSVGGYGYLQLPCGISHNTISAAVDDNVDKIDFGSFVSSQASVSIVTIGTNRVIITD